MSHNGIKSLEKDDSPLMNNRQLTTELQIETLSLAYFIP